MNMKVDIGYMGLSCPNCSIRQFFNDQGFPTISESTNTSTEIFRKSVFLCDLIIPNP
jgi:hypothetical protein